MKINSTNSVLVTEEYAQEQYKLVPYLFVNEDEHYYKKHIGKYEHKVHVSFVNEAEGKRFSFDSIVFSDNKDSFYVDDKIVHEFAIELYLQPDGENFKHNCLLVNGVKI